MHAYQAFNLNVTIICTSNCIPGDPISHMTVYNKLYANN